MLRQSIQLLLVSCALPLHAQDLPARLDSVMRAAERDGFSGVVRVERNGAPLLRSAYGMANRAERIAFTPQTVVQIGSNTKDFTAVAILQLQEKGKLSLDDPIGKFFPNAPADRRGVTIKQVMDHRAGFPMYSGGDFAPATRESLIDSMMKVPLLFPPGTKTSYSNPGFSLLAAIIEMTSGKTYDQYIHDSILAPLGLTHTGFLLPGFKAAELAHGYSRAGEDQGTMLAKPHAADGPYWNLRGNGGMLSTIDDMHAFYKALFETNTLMTPATRALRFDPSAPIGLAGSDGTNFFLYERFPGIHTEVIIASTNAASRAPQVRGALFKVLGIADDNGSGPGEGSVKRPGGTPAPDGIASLLREFVSLINSKDAAKIRAFIASHFDSNPDSPSLDERTDRFSKMRENLGELTVTSIESFPAGPVEMRVNSSAEGVVVMAVNVDAAAPYRIHGIQVRIGG